MTRNPIEAWREYHPDRPYWLYRYFDDQWSLIYIGITRNMQPRWNGHKVDYWRKYVHHIKADESFPTRAEARDIERKAIRAEQPMFNGTHITAATAVRALEYVEARGDNVLPCQRRLLKVVRGTGYIPDGEVPELAEACRRYETQRGADRVA